MIVTSPVHSPVQSPGFAPTQGGGERAPGTHCYGGPEGHVPLIAYRILRVHVMMHSAYRMPRMQHHAYKLNNNNNY